MPTIVAMCPYCRAGGVRAPATSVGASATCPKCKSSFTVMPSEVAPGWASNPSESATPAAETVPTAALADVTEPSPVMPGVARANTPPEPKPTPLAKRRRKREKPDVPVAKVIAPPPRNPVAEEPEPEPFVFETFEPPAAVPKLLPVPTAQPRFVAEPDEALDYGMAFALGALILVGPAVLASQLPFGRFIAAALGVVGLLGGIAALGAEGRAKLMAAGAIALHSLILLIVFFIPSVLSLDPWLGHSTDTGPVGPFAVEHGTGQRNPVTGSTWLDGANSSWEYKDVRVTVVAARVGLVELTGGKDVKRYTKEYHYQVHLRVANVGVERQIDLSGWAAGQGVENVRVTDAAGKPLAPAAFDGPWQPDRGKPAKQLFPGRPSDVKLVFAAPPANSGPVRVELSGTALGLPDETIRFQTGIAPLARPTP